MSFEVKNSFKKALLFIILSIKNKFLFVLISSLLIISSNAQKITVTFQDEMAASPVINRHIVKVNDKYSGYEWVGKTSWSLPKNLVNMKAGLKLQVLDVNTKEKKEKDFSDGKDAYTPISPTLKYVFGKVYFLLQIIF